MKKLSLLLLSACTVLFVSSKTFAATISVVPGSPVTEFKYSNGDIITSTGNYSIRVGFFTNVSDSNFLTSLNDANYATTIANSFKPLGEGGTNLGPTVTWDIVALTGGGAGKFSIQKSLNGTTQAPLTFVDATTNNPANTVSSSGLIRGTRLFVLAYNNADASKATEIGVYSSDQWIVPTNTSTLLTMQLSQVDTSAEVYRGSLGSLVLSPISVPEPSLLPFLGLGLLITMRKRKVAH